MLEVLLREEDIDRNREHFWVLSLSNNNRILLLELISLGSKNKTIVEPTEVFSFALQKQVAKIILVHNHPSGELTPSAEDLDLTDRLIQVGKIVNWPVIHHLIITVDDYISFADTGLLADLEQNSKYAFDFTGAQIRRVENNKAEEIAIKLIKEARYDLKGIKNLTGLTMKQLEKLRETSTPI